MSLGFNMIQRIASSWKFGGCSDSLHNDYSGLFHGKKQNLPKNNDINADIDVTAKSQNRDLG